ncbi:hypothetical protein SAMN04488107_0921 [Geodermatophilus saharensis]|uniref:Uncharacterized protein n=1 Tax=Geodermatophilus saharensis TaxID=1137994 RepID=A0A239B678_9ACTN|nr:hypothetical protein [Geodermatophilus saharensis]SNS02743.1 hypothetical protein SAMN04488107_0921 [Geodermatophilus saharensis]
MAGDASTVRKPLSCRLGFHAYVQRRPEDERLRGPDHKICRRCGRHQDIDTTIIPPGVVG